MKKNIAFIISGQFRGFDLENHSKFIFTEELNTLYNYDVFIVVDNVDKKKYYDYFGDKLKSIFCTDTDIDEEYQTNNIIKNDIHQNLLISSFRTKIAFKLIEKEGKKYDYIFKMRPDVIIYNNIINNFKLLDILQNRQIYFIWDMCIIGRFDIMKYFCNLYDKLPVKEKENNNNIFIHNGLISYDNYKNWPINAPETQICELLMDYLKVNNMSIDESLKDSHIDCSLYNRNFKHHKNNKFPDNYYDLCEDYKLLDN